MNSQGDNTVWLKCETPLWPRRTVEGGWIFGGFGQCWRRWTGERWEYRQDEETEENWLDRQL